MNNGCEAVLDQRLTFIRQKAPHDQDARLEDAAAAELDTFVDRAHREPTRAFTHQHASHFQRAVAVSVSLDHAHHLDIGTHHLAHVAVVCSYLLTGNQHVRTKWRQHSHYSNGA